MKTAEFATPLTALLVATAVWATPADAQHDRESAYAHTQSDEFPTLTPEEVAALRNGEGMGLARPAELNHFPGPRHLLDLAEDLGLSAAQLERVSEIRGAMSEAAIAKGAEILRAESHLAGLFADGSPTEDDVVRVTAHLGAMRGELQAIHLRAHLEVARVLTDEQIRAYDRLRGYAGG